MRTGEWEPGSTAAAAPISIGSPKGVPVPCISSAVTLLGVTAAALMADKMTACWLGPLGAVRLLERPSYNHMTTCVQKPMKGRFSQTVIFSLPLSQWLLNRVENGSSNLETGLCDEWRTKNCIRNKLCPRKNHHGLAQWSRKMKGGRLEGV